MSLRGQRTVATSDCTSVRLVVADCGNTYLAIPGDVVRGVLSRGQVSDNDVLSFLGVSYPRVDLAGRFGLRRKVSGAEARVILCSEGDRYCAFEVDEVIGLVEVGRASMLPLPVQFRGEERRWFGGLLLFGETAALVLNPGRMQEKSHLAFTGSQPHALLTSSSALRASPVRVGRSDTWRDKGGGGMLKSTRPESGVKRSRLCGLVVFSVGGQRLGARAEEVGGVSRWPETIPVPSETPFVKAVARREKEVLAVFDFAERLNVRVQGTMPLCLVVKHEDGPMVIRIDEEIPALQMVEQSAVQPYIGSDPDIVATYVDGAQRIPIYSLARLGKMDTERLLA